MSVSTLFNIGTTAIDTINQLLEITSQNVANANTAGYTLQEAVLKSIPAGSTTPTGSSGNGVEINQIKRVYNSFINSQLSTENANLSYWNNYKTGITQVENVFNETSSTGISPAITAFFNDWQNVSQDPQDDAQRTTLLQDASYLSSRVSTASNALTTQRSQLLTDSQSLANQVNTISAQIAGLNKEIASNPGALDLEDQRDTLVNQLNSIVKVSSFVSNSGLETVLIGGAPLVEGTNSFNLGATADTSNMMHFYVTQGNTDVDVTSSIAGGQLKANLDLRDTQIPAYSNQLNAFAIDLAGTVNYYQNQGYGLNGAPGGNLFQPLTSQEKYTSVDSTYGVFTSPAEAFSQNGGTLTLKLGDNDTGPATVNVAAGASLAQTVADINAQAGSKVSAKVLNMGQATEFTVTSGVNDTIATNVGTVTLAAGTYSEAGLAAAITSAHIGINVTYNGSLGQFAIASAGATSMNSTSNMGSLIGFDFSSSPAIGSGITGTSVDDYRISIAANPASNLSDLRIGVATTDSAGSGLNLLGNSSLLSSGVGGAGAVISSVSVTNTDSTVSNAQYNIDYVDPFVITSGNNAIKFTYNGNTYTATLNAGTYSGSAMASEIARAMNAATSAGGDGTPFAVDYGISSPNKFTITDNGTNASDTAQILWTNAATTVTPQQFGFTPGSNSPTINPNGGTVTGESLADATIINSTNNTIGFTDTTTGTNYTATIAPGAYTSDGLAAAIQNALNLAKYGTTTPAHGFTVDFGVTQPNELTIQNNSLTDSMTMFTGGSGGASATPQQFGFNPAATTTIAPGGALSAATVVASPYQADSSGIYWRVMESTDGSTWTAVNPNTSYDPSNSTTLNESGVNLASDTSGSSWRTLEFQGIQVRIDGNGINGTTNTIAAGSSYTGSSLSFPQVITQGLNDKVNFTVGANNYTATIAPGTYASAAALAAAIQTAFNTADAAVFPAGSVTAGASNEINIAPVNSVTFAWSKSTAAPQQFGMTPSAPPNGETFNVGLNPNAASDMAVQISDPSQVAAAADTWTVDSTNNSVVFSVNGGIKMTAVIPAGSYTNDPGQSDDISAALTTAIQTAYQTAAGSTLSDQFNVVFNPNTKQFKIIKDTGTDSVDLQWSSSDSTAKQIFGFSGDSDTTLTDIGDSAVSDNPASVLASANQGVPGGNTNATVIADIANGNLIEGTTPVDAYMSLVSNVGVQGSTANSFQQYESNFVTQLTQEQQAVSGVSLDQEAADLVMYEKSYQAAAQLITVADNLLSTLMTMVSGTASG